MLRNRNDTPQAGASTIALQALTFQLADDGYRQRFLAQCGIEPQHLPDMVHRTDFLAGILDMMLRDESLLLAFCADTGLDPEEVERASLTLSRTGNA